MPVDLRVFEPEKCAPSRLAALILCGRFGPVVNDQQLFIKRQEAQMHAASAPLLIPYFQPEAMTAFV
ncbi:MAG TPA: hypothetical protein VF207_08215 [Chthoniobacterales bacterium]